MEELLQVHDVAISAETRKAIEDKLTSMFRSGGCAYDDILYTWIPQDNGKFTLTGYGVWND